jgi:serine/threonine protein kinase
MYFSIPREDGTWTQIKTSQQELLRIGEGAASVIYSYESGDGRQYAIKLFKSADKAPWDKLIFLKNKYAKASEKALALGDWATSTRANSCYSMAWPISLVHKNDDIDGLCTNNGGILNDSENRMGIVLPFLDPKEWLTLDHWIEFHLLKKLGSERNSLSRRLQILRNLSVALTEMHASGMAMIDIKPANICVERKSGRVCLLDVDSFRVDDKDTIFQGTHVSPSYILPSRLGSTIDFALFDKTQDEYAFAVISFQLMNYGIHPFQHISFRMDDDNHTIDSKAQRYLYAYDDNGALPSINPMPQSVHKCWPMEFRRLLSPAFREGGSPTAMEKWAAYLSELVNRSDPKLAACSTHPRDASHIHFADHACMACTRTGQVKDLRDLLAKERVAAQTQPPLDEPELQSAVPPNSSQGSWTAPMVGLMAMVALGLLFWAGQQPEHKGSNPGPVLTQPVGVVGSDWLRGSSVSNMGTVNTQRVSPSGNATSYQSFHIKNYTSQGVYVAFYAKGRTAEWSEWPLLGVYNENYYKLKCEPGEKICYGAWNSRGSWGVGKGGYGGCNNCCATCNGGNTEIPTLK